MVNTEIPSRLSDVGSSRPERYAQKVSRMILSTCKVLDASMWSLLLDHEIPAKLVQIIRANSGMPSYHLRSGRI